jgi:hypothetical protein
MGFIAHTPTYGYRHPLVVKHPLLLLRPLRALGFRVVPRQGAVGGGALAALGEIDLI